MNLTRTLLTTTLLTGLAVAALADHGPNGQPPVDTDGIRALLSPATGVTGFGKADYETRTIYAEGPVTITGQRFRAHVAQTYTTDPTGTAPSVLTLKIDTKAADYTCSLPLESIGQRGERNGRAASASVWVARYELSVFSNDDGPAYSEQSGASCVPTTNTSTWAVPIVATGDGAMTVTNPASAVLFTGSF